MGINEEQYNDIKTVLAQVVSLETLGLDEEILGLDEESLGKEYQLKLKSTTFVVMQSISTIKGRRTQQS